MRDFGEFTSATQGATGYRRRTSVLWLALAVLVVCAGLALTAFAVRELSGNPGSVTGGSEGGEGLARASEDPRAVNVLLMGLDGGKDEQEEGVQRADTLMLARMYPETGRVRLLSIPRDLYVESAGEQGEKGRINSAYAYGGAEASVETVEGLTGIPVDHYVAADFEGFEKAVDALGGVEVKVDKEYLSHRGIPPGEQVLSGKEALLYARYRKTPKGDLGRIQRQQKLLEALRSKVVSWDSLGNSPEIIRTLNEHVETDMGAAQMASLGRTLVQSGGDGGLESYQLRGKHVTLSDGREVLVPPEERNEDILYSFLQ